MATRKTLACPEHRTDIRHTGDDKNKKFENSGVLLFEARDSNNLMVKLSELALYGRC